MAIMFIDHDRIKEGASPIEVIRADNLKADLIPLQEKYPLLYLVPVFTAARIEVYLPESVLDEGAEGE